MSTCTCKCKLDASLCNDRQQWNSDRCRCECKELIDKLDVMVGLYGILVHVNVNVINMWCWWILKTTWIVNVEKGWLINYY